MLVAHRGFDAWSFVRSKHVRTYNVLRKSKRKVPEGWAKILDVAPVHTQSISGKFK